MNHHFHPLKNVFVVLALFTLGCGQDIGPNTPTKKPLQKTPPSHETQATLMQVVQTYEAVGTIRPETETLIEAQVTAKIQKIPVAPGNTVTKGEILIILDNRHLVSRLDQAKASHHGAVAAQKQAHQTLMATKAGFKKAKSAYDRIRGFHAASAATEQQLEEAEATFLTAEAEVLRAKEALSAAKSQIRQTKEVVKEARIALGYAKLKAPESGEVLKKMAEAGDLALPGKPLLVLRTSRRLILEAYVREGLIGTIKLGDRLNVVLTTLSKSVMAEIKEIVPYADPKTRTFLVKATLPFVEGLFPGMYGKLLVPVETTQVVTLPQKAITRVGQLELVHVKVNETWQQRYVQTGDRLGDRVEVLTGLKPGEKVGY